MYYVGTYRTNTECYRNWMMQEIKYQQINQCQDVIRPYKTRIRNLFAETAPPLIAKHMTNKDQ